MTIEIICPLYKAENYIENLHNSLLKQKNVNIKKISYILTECNDNSESILKQLKANYSVIKPNEFSHSLTRETAAMKTKADIIVFITQDIEIKDDNWLEKLVKPIINKKCVASYSRQLTKFNNIEKYTREANYPEKSFIKSKKDIKKMGLKTFFFSDACSAVDAKVYKELNGYDGKDLPTNEDMYLAYKLIMNGYKIKYCADSIVYHSHNFKLKEIYQRYKLTGIFFKENKYLDEYGTGSSGASFAKYVLKRILQEHRIGLLFRYPFDMAARLFGMKAGER